MAVIFPQGQLHKRRGQGWERVRGVGEDERDEGWGLVSVTVVKSTDFIGAA